MIINKQVLVLAEDPDVAILAMIRTRLREEDLAIEIENLASASGLWVYLFAYFENEDKDDERLWRCGKPVEIAICARTEEEALNIGLSIAGLTREIFARQESHERAGLRRGRRSEFDEEFRSEGWGLDAQCVAVFKARYERDALAVIVKESHDNAPPSTVAPRRL